MFQALARIYAQSEIERIRRAMAILRTVVVSYHKTILLNNDSKRSRFRQTEINVEEI